MKTLQGPFTVNFFYARYNSKNLNMYSNLLTLESKIIFVLLLYFQWLNYHLCLYIKLLKNC